MSFVCNIKKSEIGILKYNFNDEQKTLEDNLANADKIVAEELIDQNINFLKRLKKKLLYPKVIKFLKLS